MNGEYAWTRQQSPGNIAGDAAVQALMEEAVRDLAPAERGRVAGAALVPLELRVDGMRYRVRLTAIELPGGRRDVLLLETVAEHAAESASDDLRLRFGLTAREVEVALLLARRLTNRELAERLLISEHTARRHTERVMHKLGVRRRGEITRVLLEARGGRAA